MKNFVIVLVSIVFLVTGCGMVALSSYITPTPLDQKSILYVAAAGVTDANEYGGYANLYKAERLKKDVDVSHIVIQFRLQQMIDKDILTYSIHKDVVTNNAEVGKQREEAIFSEKGLLSMGLSLAGFGTLTGVIGLMRKRPTDWTKDEVDVALNEVGAKTTTELMAKNKHLTQVISGIDAFRKKYKDNSDVILALKAVMNEAQDTDTQIEVATIKKGA